MKKIIAVLLMVTVLICGCGEGEKQEVSQEQNQEETEKDNSESGNQETEEEIKEMEDMSQAEWIESGGADNMEDGYEKVESINIDSSDTKLEYKKKEKYALESGEEVLLLYFDFSNISARETTVDGQYNFSAFQDGVEITVYSYVPDEFEPFRNRDKQILDGANIEFGIAVKPENWESNIKLRVDDCMAYDSQDVFHTFQQQELEIKDIKIEENTESIESIILSDGEEGEYGQYDLFDGEPYLRFYVPIGIYTVKCKKEGGFYIESIEKHKEDGFETTDVIQQINMSEGEEREISIEEGQCIYLYINTEIELIKQ